MKSNLKLEENINELKEILERAWKFPFSGGKAFVNVEKILELIFDIEDSFPKEFSQAKNIVADRTKILNEAKEESKRMINAAEEKIKAMLSKDEFLKRAKEVAENLVKESRSESREIKKATNNYIEDITKNVEKTLTDGITSIRELRRKLKGLKLDET